MELVLDLPMAADVGVEGAVGRQAADVVAHLGGLLAADASRRLDPDDGLQFRPALVAHPYDGIGVEGLAEPDLYPPVPLVHVRVLGCGALVVAHRLHVLQQGLLVALDGKDVVRACLDDLLRDVLLCPHRVDGDDGALDVEHLYQLGDGRYLVALVARLELAEAQGVGHASRAYDVQRILAVERVLAPAHCLPVYRHHAAGLAAVAQPQRPFGEQPLEMAGVD